MYISKFSNNVIKIQDIEETTSVSDNSNNMGLAETRSHDWTTIVRTAFSSNVSSSCNLRSSFCNMMFKNKYDIKYVIILFCRLFRLQKLLKKETRKLLASLRQPVMLQLKLHYKKNTLLAKVLLYESHTLHKLDLPIMRQERTRILCHE